MTKTLLFSIVNLCERSHAHVRGIICDMGNCKLLRELNVYSESKHFFENPADKNRKIYIFPDVPHCMKNLRNHCLDYNLCLKGVSDKTVFLKKEHFEELISNEQSDFKLCPKVSFVHLNCKGNDRQRVKYAVQLFSDTVAKALVFKFGDRFLEQAKIISIIDAWFDVMDSRKKYHWKKNKCAFGLYEQQQTDVLKKMLDLVQNMYFGDETSLKKKPFQTGIIVSIHSTLDLFTDLKKEGISFLLTSKLNQDALENVFSQIRALGGNMTHPTTVETINRIRTICLSKNVHSILSNSCPVELNPSDEDDVFLSVNLLDDILPDLSEDLDTVSDEILDIDFHSNESRNYVAGYICKKLSLLPNKHENLNSWIHVKGTVAGPFFLSVRFT
jgi:hypothetical protein